MFTFICLVAFEHGFFVFLFSFEPSWIVFVVVVFLFSLEPCPAHRAKENKKKRPDLAGRKRKKKRKQLRTRSKFGLRSSRWCQNDREGWRGYFCEFWSWKTLKKPETNQDVLRYFPQLFCGFSPNSRKFMYKRLGAKSQNSGIELQFQFYRPPGGRNRYRTWLVEPWSWSWDVLPPSHPPSIK